MMHLAHVLRILHGVTQGHERSHAAAASGAIVRKLRIGALWNLSSLPNAVIALAGCVHIVVGESGPTQTTQSVWASAQLWLLPLGLLLTKVLQAQAFVVLAAAAGFTATDWKMWAALRRYADRSHAGSRLGSAPPSPTSPAPPSSALAGAIPAAPLQVACSSR